MESAKAQHTGLDATSAVRPVQGAAAGASPAGKIRAMFTPPEDPDRWLHSPTLPTLLTRPRVPQNILFVEDLTERVAQEFPELWKLGQAYFKVGQGTFIHTSFYIG